MEDSGEEWEIEEYYTSSGEEECESKVSWILNRGLQLGKKVVITGVVISSAPIVLPPLLVVSALGFAVSVPFGVVFASYTFTEKLMNKLLPIPAPSSMLEYQTGITDDDEEEESDFKGELALEEDEKKQIEDMKLETEIRNELVDDGNKDQQGEYVLGDNDLRDIQEVDGEKLYKDESLKEKGYEEDVGEYLEGGDEGSLGVINIEIKGAEEEVDKKPVIEESKNEKPSSEVRQVVVVREREKKNANDVTKTDELVLVARGVPGNNKNVEKVTSNEDDKVLKAKTKGLLEKIRDGAAAAEPVKKNKNKNKNRVKKSLGAGENKEDKHGKNTKEMDEKLNKQLADIHGQAGRKGVETMPYAKKGNQRGTVERVIVEKIVADDASSASAAPKTRILTNGNHGAESTNIIEVRPGSVVSDEKEAFSIGSNAERRETAEERNNNKNVKSLDKPMQDGFPKSKHDGVTSKVDSAISSNEILLTEEKIWEQINAMRKIVGYKAAPQSSCIEELKALYVFTGVEQPSSFGKSVDLREAEDKLHFLMSIVGVK